MSYLPLVFQMLLVSVAATAAAFDWRSRRIPNWLTFSGMAAGLGLNTFVFGWPGLKLALEGFGLAVLIYVPLFLLRGMGAGDVKLMAAVGAITGPANWLGIFIATGILGGLAALVLLLARGRLKKTLWNVVSLLHSLLRLRAPYAAQPDLDVSDPRAITLPHGVVIAAGCLVFIGASAFLAPH
jgi:prepilin peptidase CpaA